MIKRGQFIQNQAEPGIALSALQSFG